MSTAIIVEGMSCGQCEQTAEGARRCVNDVTGATADGETGPMSVGGDGDARIRAVADATYTARARREPERTPTHVAPFVPGSDSPGRYCTGTTLE